MAVNPFWTSKPNGPFLAPDRRFGAQVIAPLIEIRRDICRLNNKVGGSNPFTSIDSNLVATGYWQEAVQTSIWDRLCLNFRYSG